MSSPHRLIVKEIGGLQPIWIVDDEDALPGAYIRLKPGTTETEAKQVAALLSKHLDAIVQKK
jgi:hypothetical protein